MDRRVQIALLVVIITALVVAGVYAAGWFRKTSTAEIICYIHHEEGSEGVGYNVWTSEYEPPYSPLEALDERSGEVAPGEVAETIIMHKWNGIGPSTVRVHVHLSCIQAGENRVILHGTTLMMVPGGQYRLDCHILLKPSNEVTEYGVYIQDAYTEYPSYRDLFSQTGSAGLEFGVHRDNPDDDKRFSVFVDGELRISGNFGPLSTHNITVDVLWDWPREYHNCHIEVITHDQNSTVHSEVILVDSGTTVPVTVII
ncbi:MAG: hypothetical protein JSV90_07800 [Methanobacteriota archaeon]|nr:MAG: hypothetical protein JSV90_07800 [Euryarchaeota archaeon]